MTEWRDYLPALLRRHQLVFAMEPAFSEFRQTPRQTPECSGLRSCPEQTKQYKSQYEEECEAYEDNSKDILNVHGRTPKVTLPPAA